MSLTSRTNNIIRVCALTLDPYDINPGQRFRIEQWEPFLKTEGIEIDYFPFTDDKLRAVIYQPGRAVEKAGHLTRAIFRRAGHILKASEYDAVILYRAASMVGPAWFEKFMRRRNLPVVFDFDDAIFLTNTSKANERFGWAKFSGKTADICRYSTIVTVGNSYLAEYARKYNENVHVVPTSIDTDKYQPVAERESNGRVIVGWTGSSTSQYHLEAFEPVLTELVRERDVEIRVISDRKPAFENVQSSWRAWSSKGEIKETSEIDIGIMPTPDDEWSRGKCAAKALQYMALGIPAVCSDMGANRDVIRHGENGFLAETPDEWLTALKTLIDDESLRAKMGVEARKTVVENYSMRKCAALFAQAVRDSVSAKIKNTV